MQITSRLARLAVMALTGASSLSACLSSAAVEPLQHGGRPVLFIGNSLTYYNDLPGIVQSLADSAHGDSAAWAEVSNPPS